MYIKKSRAPSILPCGTPTVTGFGVEVELLMKVTAVRDDKYNVNQFRTEVENPRFLNFFISRVWSTVSKAFLKSMKTAPVVRLLSRLSKISSVSLVNAMLVDKFGRKPNCSEVIRLCSFRHSYIGVRGGGGGGTIFRDQEKSGNLCLKSRAI